MMKKSKEFDDILNECLDRLLIKSETVEQCLASYPGQADELKPLLQVAMATKQASAIQPRPDFRARARYQFRSALQEMEGKRNRSLFGWLPQWATVVTITLVFLLVAGGGTVAAAGNSMPDNPLYPVKLATEQVRLTLTFSDMGKAELYAKLADKRVAEIVRMVNKDKPEHVERAAQRLNTYLAMVASLALAQRGEEAMMLAPAPQAPAASLEELAPGERAREERGGSQRAKNLAKLRTMVKHYAADNPVALHALLKTAPEEIKPALLRAIAMSEAGYQKALEALE